MKHNLKMNDFLKLSVFFNVIYIGIMFTIARGTQCNLLTDELAIVAGISIAMIFNAFFMMVNFFPDLLFKNIKKVRVEKPAKPKELSVQKVTDSLEICDTANNPFIKKGATPADVTISGSASKQYNFEDIQLDVEKLPHFLIVGETGGGKSITSYNLINQLNQQYDYPKIAIVDMGNYDYDDAIATTTKEFIHVLELFYVILLGRQKQGKKVKQPRLILLVEEFEAALAGINSLPKKERDRVEQRLGDIARMGRKGSMNLFFVVQSGKASDFDSKIRNNFGNIFVHRSPRNLSSMFSCPHDIANIPTGSAWFGKANGIVKFPLVEEPHMNLATLLDLKLLAGFYERRFGIKIYEDDDE